MEQFTIWIPSRKVVIIWAAALLVFLIIVIILSKKLSDSIKASAQNNGRINQYLAAVPAEQIGTISAVYQNTRTSLGHALILAVVGGTFGLQRAYLGKRRSAALMFVFFWTGIPSIIAIFDIVNMPKTVSEFNLNVVQSLYEQIALDAYTNKE